MKGMFWLNLLQILQFRTFSLNYMAHMNRGHQIQIPYVMAGKEEVLEQEQECNRVQIKPAKLAL